MTSPFPANDPVHHASVLDVTACASGQARWDSSDARRRTSSASPRRKANGNGNANGVHKANENVPSRRKKKPIQTSPEDSPRGAGCSQWIVDNQIQVSLLLLFTLGFTHMSLPAARPFTIKFLSISYRNPIDGLYAKGTDDGYFVAFWIVSFTFLRAACMEYVFMPFARINGIKTKKAGIRFAEQAWSFVYASVFWTLGMKLMYESKYWLNTREMWTDWPLRQIDGTFKWYYLVQFAFWLQQIFVLNVEERRKDYHQMFAHHIVTCCLMGSSWLYHQTKVGNSILCVMDIIDILLPFAKMLKYLDFQKSCDIAFGVFLVCWFIFRHVFYLTILWSAVFESSTVMYGCYPPGVPTSPARGLPIPQSYFEQLRILPYHPDTGTFCWTKPVHYGFMAFLVALQILTIIWFYMIIRIAVKVIRGAGADDDRSDDEDDGDDEMEPDSDWSEEDSVQMGTPRFKGDVLQPVPLLVNRKAKKQKKTDVDG